MSERQEGRRISPPGLAAAQEAYGRNPESEQAALALGRALRGSFAGEKALALLEDFLGAQPLSGGALRLYLALLREHAPRDGILRLTTLYQRAAFPFVADALLDVRIPPVIDFFAALLRKPARLFAVRALCLGQYAEAARLALSALQEAPRKDERHASTLCCAVAMSGQYGKYDAQLAVKNPEAGEALLSVRSLLQGYPTKVHPDAVPLFARVATEIANTLPEHGAVSWLEMAAGVHQGAVAREMLRQLDVIEKPYPAFRYARRLASFEEGGAARAAYLNSAADYARAAGKPREAYACLSLAAKEGGQTEEREEAMRFLSWVQSVRREKPE